jgi:hypothetical protein
MKYICGSKNKFNENFRVKPTFIALSAICITFSCFLGIIGHERINRAAVMALPKPLQTFFYNHIDFNTQESTVPDLRRNVINDKAEPPRHYFDMENYGAVETFLKQWKKLKQNMTKSFN